MSSILSIVPYKFLPPTNGGHWGVIIVEKILSVFNRVHTVTTDNNELLKSYSFTIHPVFTSGKSRYLPFSQLATTYKLAKEVKPDYIFCHHHYMFPMAKRVSEKLGIPIYIRCHNIEAERFKSTGKWWWKAMRFFEKSSFLKADGVFFVTEEDKDWARTHYGLPKEKAIVMPFGIDFQHTPVLPENSKSILAQAHNLHPDIPWLFFMGQLDYGPNEEAVRFIINDILPILKDKMPEGFQILICGKNLSIELQQQLQTPAVVNHIRYLGFVPDIEQVIASCAVMINPVVAGGGVKTKVVESLAWNKTVVSAYSGAIGIETSVCGHKLLIAPDGDWQYFVSLIEQALRHEEHTIPDAYFDYYYSANIAARMQVHFTLR